MVHLLSMIRGYLQFFFLLTMIGYTFFARAGQDPVVTTVLDGKLSQIKAGQSRLTYDPVFYSANKSYIADTTKDVYRNVISLLIDEEDRTFITSNFTVEVDVKIRWWAKNGTYDSITRTLTVNYDTAAGSKYKARDYFYFDNARKVEMEIMAVDSNGVSWFVTKLLRLENRMEVNRDYTFNCTLPIDPVEATEGIVEATKFDELIVSWPATPQFSGITHYDIEWAWIDEEALPRYKKNDPSTSTLRFFDKLIFRNNSSRATVISDSNRFAVPMFYDGTGYLFYRVRPVQHMENGQIVEGAWNTNGFEDITYYEFIDGHEPSINWQASTTWAEEGKRNSIVNYFDGTQRNRQTVSKDNTTYTTIVTETFYDYQGRPSINILPAPTLSNVIAYASNFNRFINHTADPKSLYDLTPEGVTICNTNTPVLDSAYGTSNYYSGLNPLVNTGIHKYIPNGDGYPYSETRYTPDATGRIASQGGVGPVHQINGGHDTKYFYGMADQRELNALFGTEVGYASHYYKNMMRDANGQYSVIYADMHNRTIATALAGAPPANLKALDSYPTAPPYMKRNLLHNNVVKDRSIQSSTSLLVPMAGNHQFEYSLNPQSAEIVACNPEGQTVCYDCYYDLEIRITGTCVDAPIIITRKNFTFGTYDTTCENDPPSLTVDTTIYMAEGEYNIVKTLSLSQAAQDWYRDSFYIKKNLCKTLHDFYEEIYAEISANVDCNITCEECNERLGTEGEYRAELLTQMGLDPLNPSPFDSDIALAYKEAKANCDYICGLSDNKLLAMRTQMLMDISPGEGQYARLDVDLNNDGQISGVYCPTQETNPDPLNCVPEKNSDKKYNIFNPDKPSYKDPRDESDPNPATSNKYKDANGQVDEEVARNLQGMTPEQFSNLFGSNWAQSLLYHHPEYCKLKKAETDLPESFKFDTKLESVDTWVDAMSLNYDDIISEDPFFDAVPASWADKMALRISNYFQDKSMWQIAIGVVNCRNTYDPSCLNGINPAPPYSPGICTGDWNVAWRIFRTLYMTEKDRLLNQYLDEVCNINYTELKNLNYTRRFGSYDDFMPSNMQAMLNNLLALASSNPNQLENEAESQFDQQAEAEYELTCAGYIEGWRQRLLQCETLANHSFKDAILSMITSQMKDVCKRGSDVDHMYGSSTVKPNDPVSPRSFEEIIRNVFQIYSIPLDATCHPWMINYPEPYELQTPVSNSVIAEQKDECVCKRITELRVEQKTVGYTGTFSQFIQYQHGVTIRQTLLDSLIAGCETEPGCVMYDPAIAIPAILDCETRLKNCIDCKEYDTWKTAFKAEFPSFTIINYSPGGTLTEAQVNQNVAFADYMNYHTGLNKSWYDYLGFDSTCRIYNQDTLNCKKLDSLMTVFLAGPNGNSSGDSCRYYFTQFFNTALGTAYTFAQIQNLFVQHCGHLPDVCAPVLNCKEFENVISQFYATYGPSVRDSANCKTLFTTFFNNYFGTSFTWQQIWDLHLKLCGGELDVCKAISCKDIGNVMQTWLNCNHNSWMSGTCMADWVTYFNSLMGTSLQEWEIEEFYKRCGLPYHPCDPPINSSSFENLVTNYNNGSATICATQPSCHDCLATYVSGALGRKYTYEQIALLYRSITGKELPACEGRWNIKELFDFSKNYIETHAGNFVQCDSLFTAAFDTSFNVSFTYEQIMAVYELYTGERPEVCQKEYTLSCTQLTNIFNSFIHTYPDPIGYFGDSLSKVAYTAYFNHAVNDTLTWDGVNEYYESLCGKVLTLVTGTAPDPEGFVAVFMNKYATYGLPKSLLRDVFTTRYNKTLRPRRPFTWQEIMTTMNNLQAGWIEPLIFSNVNDTLKCENIPGVILAFYELNNDFLPNDCRKSWTDMFNQYFSTSFTDYDQLQSWFKDNCDTTYNLCGYELAPAAMTLRSAISTPPTTTSPRLCSDVIFPDAEPQPDPCNTSLQTLAWNAANELYNTYVENQLDNFDSIYRAKCLSAGSLETFTVRSQVAEYHYTLYYYDQAGNLVKTVPPAGVAPDYSDGFFEDVEDARANGTVMIPVHSLESNYRYNTLDDIVQQKSPDAGLKKAWYDIFGRLALSQDAHQINHDQYTYTKYDILGRIIEGGRLTKNTEPDLSDLTAWINSASSTYEEIAKINYDEVVDELCGYSIGICQQNLRNRVSYTSFTNSIVDLDYSHATYYTYDTHGNVDTLLHHYNSGILHSTPGNAFKKISYNYNLESGKVNQVSYQPGSKDQFFYRYEYDAHNRLTKTFTSHDRVYWRKQQENTYFLHGLLARSELGELAVQGLDFSYTINGLLKGVNSTALGTGFDPGQDGEITSLVAQDAYSFNLNYYSNDYRPINTSIYPFSIIPDGLPQLSADGVNTGKDQFGKHAKAIVVNIPKFSTTSALEGVKLYGYQYDQLLRVTASNAYKGLNATTNNITSVAIPDYKERLTYDANNNIISYQRNGTTENGNNLDMDNMTYSYYPNSNKLNHVYDAVSPGNYGNDIDAQNANNYIYDETGNLIFDDLEDITNIEWTLRGKIKKVRKLDGTIISYEYDENGDRIEKKIGDKSTVYVRDEDGKVLAIYENDNSEINGGKLSQIEVHLYGNKRIGLWKANRDVESEGWSLISSVPMTGTSNDGSVDNTIRGSYQYELENHLGNVLVTVTDKKIGIDLGSDGDIDYYQADVITATDYYMFGSLMPERKFDVSGSYRYGYNGKENDNEVKGEGNQQDYGMRIYDPRLGKFLSVDPLQSDFPWNSPYAYAENDPVNYVDLDGLEKPNEVAADDFVDQKTNTNVKPGNKSGSPFRVTTSQPGKVVTMTPPRKPELKIRAGGNLVSFCLRNAWELTKFGLECREESKYLRQQIAELKTQKEAQVQELAELETSNAAVMEAKEQKQQGKRRKEVEKKGQKFWVTYTKTKINDDGTVIVYSGRSSGYTRNLVPTDAEAQAAVDGREATHFILNSENFQRAVLDKKSTDKWAIRGREQELIDFYGGAQSEGGISRNKIRAVSRKNTMALIYKAASYIAFGHSLPSRNPADSSKQP